MQTSVTTPKQQVGLFATSERHKLLSNALDLPANLEVIFADAKTEKLQQFLQRCKFYGYEHAILDERSIANLSKALKTITKANVTNLNILLVSEGSPDIIERLNHKLAKYRVRCVALAPAPNAPNAPKAPKAVAATTPTIAEPAVAVEPPVAAPVPVEVGTATEVALPDGADAEGDGADAEGDGADAGVAQTESAGESAGDNLSRMSESVGMPNDTEVIVEPEPPAPLELKPLEQLEETVELKKIDQEPVQSAEPAQSAVPTQTAEPTQPAEPTVPAEPTARPVPVEKEPQHYAIMIPPEYFKLLEPPKRKTRLFWSLREWLGRVIWAIAALVIVTLVLNLFMDLEFREKFLSSLASFVSM